MPQYNFYLSDKEYELLLKLGDTEKTEIKKQTKEYLITQLQRRSNKK